jgi:hypothetical protein
MIVILSILQEYKAMATKMNLGELKDLFIVKKVAGYGRISKHQAGKKGFKHAHTFSKGELKDSGKYNLGRFGVLNSLPLHKRNEIANKFSRAKAAK